jgi:hypothetical protein
MNKKFCLCGLQRLPEEFKWEEFAATIFEFRGSNGFKEVEDADTRG